MITFSKTTLNSLLTIERGRSLNEEAKEGRSLPGCMKTKSGKDFKEAVSVHDTWPLFLKTR